MYEAINTIDWRSAAQDKLVELVALLGLPQWVAPDSGGFAEWHPKTFLPPLEIVKLTDEGVMSWSEERLSPARVLVSIRFNISDQCYGATHRLHDGLMYDQQYRMLSARTSSFEKCIAVLAACTSLEACITPERLIEANKKLQGALTTAAEDMENNSQLLYKNMRESYRSIVHAKPDGTGSMQGLKKLIGDR